MATEVAVINGSSGVQTFYSTYSAARKAASSGDTIQIWADLTGEQILLKDGVDIWMAPGRVIDMNDEMPTITDGDTVTCNIFGNGIIKNSYNGVTDNRYECILITDSASKISIQCDYIEGIGAVYSPSSDANQGYSIFVNGVSSSQKFHLSCNKVINKNNSAIIFALSSEETPTNDINIRVQTVLTGISGQSGTGRTAMELTGTGYVDIDEIICLYKGSCFIHKSGNLVTSILKMTTSDQDRPALSVGEGDGTQNLTLYFDEIQNTSSGDGVKVAQGIVKLIGRRIYSGSGLSIDLASNAECLVDEIISGTKGIYIHNSSSQKVIVDSNYIEGGNGNSGVIKSDSGSNYVLRNAKIKNTATSSPSIGIYIPDGGTNNQTIEIENLIIVTATGVSDFSIYRDGSNDIHIKNLTLFVKKDISGHVKLDIGDEDNFKYIVSNDIT